MSHYFGLKCGLCEAVLVTQENCPECSHHHGYTYSNPSDAERVKRTFNHECEETK